MSNAMNDTSVTIYRVAKVVDAETLVVNKGANDGVKAGQRFLVYSIGDEVVDPDTKKSLGQLETVRGTGRVTHLQETMATIKSDMKYAPSKYIRKIRQQNPLSSVIAAFGRLNIEEETEESLPAKTAPFEKAEVGDFAKPI